MSQNDFVPLLFVPSLQKAEYYRTMLEDHDIPVEIEDEYINDKSESDSDEAEIRSDSEIAVLVPDEHLEEARHFIDQRSTFEAELETDYDQRDENDDEDEFADFEPLDPQRDAEGGAVDEYDLFDDDDIDDDEDMY